MKRSSAAFVAVLLLAGRARAHPITARLEYERGPGAEACPTEADLRAFIAQRLGSDPFDAFAERTVRVRVRRVRDELVADLEVLGKQGEVIGQRTITSRATSCGDIANALAVSLSVALDPARVAPPPPPAPEPPPPPAPAPPPPPPPPAPAREASPPVPPGPQPVWEASIGGGAALGAAPNPAAAIVVAIGGRLRAFSGTLEGRAFLPSGASVDQGNVSASSAWVALVPCLHAGVFGACALGAIGVVRGRGSGVSVPAEDSSFGASAGVRALVEAPLSEDVGLRFGGDLTTTIHGTRLLLDGREAWATPPVGGLVWTSGVLHFR